MAEGKDVMMVGLMALQMTGYWVLLMADSKCLVIRLAAMMARL